MEGLVRRCLIALLGATLDGPAQRSVRSPAFARRVDASLAAGDPLVPQTIRDAIGSRLGELGIALPTAAPAAGVAIDARALRGTHDALAWIASRDERLPARIDAAYRTQGATAREVVATIVRELALEGTGEILDVAQAVDAACEMLGKTWEPEDVQLALERELEAQPAASVPTTQAPQLVAQEPGRALPGRRHFSASSLNLYADCPRKWYFRYLCGAVEDKPSSASAYGTAFHAALEAFHKVYPSIAGVAARELELRLEGEINTAFETHRIHFSSEVEFRLNRRRAQRTAKKYLAWLQERAQKEPFEVIGCEITADIELDGLEFRGYIDRVDRDVRSGRVTVFDYKTGSIAESAAEYRRAINDDSEFQLSYYYWAQTMAGETVRSIALVPLREAHLDVNPIELEVVPSAPPVKNDGATRGVIPVIELERARTAMVDLGRKLASGTIQHFPATDDPSSCRYCVYAPSCREKPTDDTMAFAR
ncbi:MAG: RecB family exonuclease [Vulcanimicrobiaceae bacterium]